MLNKMTGMDDFQKLTSDHQDELKRPFESQLDKIQDQDLIAVISDTLRMFEEEEYSKILNRLSSLNKPESTPPKPKPSDSDQTKYDDDLEDSDFGKGEVKDGGKTPEKKNSAKEVVGIKKIEVNYSKAWIESESEVEDYLSKLKKAILKEIHDGKRIQV